MNSEDRKPLPVCIHASRSAEAVAAKRSEAFHFRDIPLIPNLFHYESQEQSQLWQEVAKKYQPDLERFYRKAFSEVAQTGLPRTPMHLVGLGAGGARKERWLLEALGTRPGMRFTPVDASESLALQSARHVQDLISAPVRPLVADVEALEDLSEWLGESDRGTVPRWFTAFGLTPNSEPWSLLPQLREFLRYSDHRLLVNANLMPDGKIESVLPEYDNPETRRWLRQVLVDWGLDEWVGEMEFVCGKFDEVDALVAEVCWKGDVELDWVGQPFHASRGDPVWIFATLRYTMDGFIETLEEHGLKVERSWESDCRREGLCLARRN